KRYGILIVDVSGHGAPSAIVMAMIRAVFHSMPSPAVDPPSVLQFINRHFRFLWGSSMLATALYAVVDPVQRRIQVACAGHLPPLLLHDGVVNYLECDATVPLLVMDLPEIPLYERPLVHGDQVLFYTDGITECEDAD